MRFSIAQELVNQIAIGGVNLYAIKTCCDRVFRGVGIVRHDARNFGNVESAGLGIFLLALCRMGITGRRGGRGRNTWRAAQEIRVHKTAHVPQLQDDPSARVMDSLRHGFPCCDLRVGPDAGRRWPAKAFLANAGCFGDDQACTAALAVIFCL